MTVLMGLATNAFGEPAPVEVCWRPAELPPGVDTFIIVKGHDGWHMPSPSRFWDAAVHHVVYKHNPNLGADSLDRFPEDIRKHITRFCVPAPVQPPSAAPPPEPPPPPKPAPPKKNARTGPKKGSGKDNGAVKDKGTAKEDGPKKPLPKPRVQSPERPDAIVKPPRKEPSSLPPSTVLLPRDFRLLPTEQEAQILPKAKDVPPLPPPSFEHFTVNCQDPKARCKPKTGDEQEAQSQPNAEQVSPLPPPSFEHFTVNCEDPKARCKRKTGDEKGPVDQRTTFEEFLKEFALFAGAMNLQLDEDLKRPDGKKHGVVGGRNANGPNTPLTQAVATFIQLAPIVRAQVHAFRAKIAKSAEKKTPVVVESKELSEEGADWLATLPGTAQGLQEAGTIGPYKMLKKFTDGWRGVFETHHIAEVQWFDKKILKGDPDLVPSVILTKEEHRRITKELGDWVRENSPPKTPQDLWKMYKKVYKQYPHWLEAIKPYFDR